MRIDTYKAFKDTFNKLFKKYHPDNKETGDAELFIKYKNAYDEALKAGVADLLPEDTITITTKQAFTGTTINYNGVKIIIPPKFYKRHRNIMFNDKDGKNHCVKIDVSPSCSNEILKYSGRYGELEITRIINVTFLDAILGGKKELDIFGEKVYIEYKPYELFNHPIKVFPNKGFWNKMNPLKRNDLTIKFMIKRIDLTKNDRKILEDMRERYGIK